MIPSNIPDLGEQSRYQVQNHSNRTRADYSRVSVDANHGSFNRGKKGVYRRGDFHGNRVQTGSRIGNDSSLSNQAPEPDAPLTLRPRGGRKDGRGGWYNRGNKA